MEQPQRPQTFNTQQTDQLLTIAVLARNSKIGANNFHWIAGLSVFNSLISAFGGAATFVVGLGLTQLIDGIAFLLARDFPANALLFKIAGIILVLLVASIFVAFGYFAGKSQRWAYITGMVLYTLDGGILLAFQDWIGFFFHLYFLWGLWKGLQALNQLQKLTAIQSGAVLDFPKDIGMP